MKTKPAKKMNLLELGYEIRRIERAIEGASSKDEREGLRYELDQVETIRAAKVELAFRAIGSAQKYLAR